MSSWLDHPPGPLGLLSRASEGFGGEETADEMRNSDTIDYSWACGACGAAISDMDSVCGACGEVVEWDKPPI